MTPKPCPAPPQPLPDDWVKWVAENRLRGCSVESMLQTMAASGLPHDDSLHALQEVERSPIYQAALSQRELLFKRDSVLSNLQLLWESDPGYGTIERITEPDPHTFLRRYVWGCRPVVLTGMARDWPALHRWTPRFFHDHFGDEQVEIQSGRSTDPRFEENKLRHRQTVRLGDFLDQLAHDHANDRYLTANNDLLRQPAFSRLLDDVTALPALCDPQRLRECSSLWIGPAGTVTPLHHDTVMLFHTQIIGRKRWRFISPLQLDAVYNFSGVFSPVDVEAPDFSRHPDFQRATVLETTLEPGDTVFLPLGWWHQVRSLDISISLSYTNLRIPNDFSYRNPSLTHW